MQKSMVEQATTAASDAFVAVKDVAVNATDSAQEVAGEMTKAVQNSVTNQPTATLLAAVAFGFVLGALWKS